MQVRKTLLAAALLAAAVNAAAADSTDVKVTGHIVPAACTPDVSGGATVDYGTIKPALLEQHAGDFTLLDEKTLAFSLRCDAAVKVAVRSVDARAGSAVIPVGKVILGVLVADNTPMFGLGLADGKKIGSYGAVLRDLKTEEGAAVGYLHSSDGGKTWVNRPKIDLAQVTQPDRLASVSAPGVKSPLPVKVLSGTLAVQAVLNKASELNLTQVVHLDGQASLQVVYL